PVPGSHLVLEAMVSAREVAPKRLEPLGRVDDVVLPRSRLAATVSLRCPPCAHIKGEMDIDTSQRLAHEPASVGLTPFAQAIGAGGFPSRDLLISDTPEPFARWLRWPRGKRYTVEVGADPTINAKKRVE